MARACDRFLAWPPVPDDTPKSDPVRGIVERDLFTDLFQGQNARPEKQQSTGIELDADVSADELR
jgi:hypothetical protein